MTNLTEHKDDIRLKDVILKLISIKQLLWKKKLQIISLSITFGLIGCVYSYFKKEIYEAHLTFVIDESQESVV